MRISVIGIWLCFLGLGVVKCGPTYEHRQPTNRPNAIPFAPYLPPTGNNYTSTNSIGYLPANYQQPQQQQQQQQQQSYSSRSSYSSSAQHQVPQYVRPQASQSFAQSLPSYLPPQQSTYNPTNYYNSQPSYYQNPGYSFAPNVQQPQQPFVIAGLPPQPYYDAAASSGFNVNFNGSPMVMRKQTIQDLCSAYAPEEKTVIYVLSQKPGGGYESVTAPPPTPASKPEVFFIKYKTPEDADFATKHIQQQYDQLGGTSQVSDEGIAPISRVESYVDSTGNVTRSLAPGSTQEQQQQQQQHQHSGYLRQ